MRLKNILWILQTTNCREYQYITMKEILERETESLLIAAQKCHKEQLFKSKKMILGNRIASAVCVGIDFKLLMTQLMNAANYN